VSIIDAVALPDEFASALGQSDGEIYKHLWVIPVFIDLTLLG
jgi:hypothetical protein